jgi:hypothetical protein
MIPVMTAGCASEDDFDSDDYDNLRGATHTSGETTSTTYVVEDSAPPPTGNCETAYAYGLGNATCFIDIPNLQSNNWGWTNWVSPGTNTVWPVYAGAGQCNIANGELVGYLTVEYGGNGTLNVMFDAAGGFGLEEAHVYVGSSLTPTGNNGQPTTAPGQYPVVDQGLGGATEVSYVFPGLSGPVYVIFHAQACGSVC